MKTLQKTYTGKYAPNHLEFDYWIDLTADAKGSVIKTYNGMGWTEISGGSQDNDSAIQDILDNVYTKDQIDEMLQQNAFEFVDLGLPSGLKWATCNIGAKNPEDAGMYFCWGETEGYYVTQGETGLQILDEAGNPSEAKSLGFVWKEYKWHTLNVFGNDTVSKYNNTDQVQLLNEDDCAYRFNSLQRMPTEQEFQELLDNTTVVSENLNGVSGKRFVGSNGNSIFIPFVMIVNDNALRTYTGVWSSSVFNQVGSSVRFVDAMGLGLNDTLTMMTNIPRYCGASVRAVQEAGIGEYYTKSEVDTKFEQLAGCTSATTTTSLVTDKNLVIATISSNDEFSLASVPAAGKEVHCIVKNISLEDVVVAIPTQTPYVNLSADSITVPASGYVEINAISDGTNVYLRTI